MIVPCGIICLTYILKCFEKDSTVESICAGLTSSSKHIWITDLGRIAIEYGLTSQVYCTSILLDTLWFQSQSFLKEKVMHHIQTEKGMRKQAYKSLLHYLEKGGTLEYRVVTRPYLENALKQEKMILACVSSAVFYEDPRHVGGHYIVVSNITDKIWILNPEPNTLTEDTITEEKFFSALSQWGNWVLLVSEEASCSV